ncbi:MAG: Rrf2 family transcriptional regulator [Myxococcota bacterium]
MRLNLATDYSLRCLLYLAVSDGSYVAAVEIADRFKISAHHVRTICKTLVAAGWVEGRRGAGGGVRLVVEPASLRVGEIVRELEPIDLVECFDPDRNDCALSPTCRLKKALTRATSAFFDTLDEYTLADLARNRQLQEIVRIEA